MRSVVKNHIYSLWAETALALLAVLLFVCPSHANLLSNGSFEQPVATSGLNCGGIADCQGFNIGDPIGAGAWTVVGPGPTDPSKTPIVILTSAYNEGGYFFQPEDGSQSLDLTGMSNQRLNGVEQTVATIPGTDYSLSFWVGHHAQDPNFYNGPASVNLLIGGSLVGTFSNNHAPPPNLLDWEQFTYSFTATGTTTTIDFFNAVADTSQNEVGLDNVALTAVPEPGSLPVLVSAISVLGLLGLGRRGAAPL